MWGPIERLAPTGVSLKATTMIHYPIKAMLVDRNADHLLLMDRALKRSICELETIFAGTGKECLDRLSREEVSIVVLDYNLPEIDGLRVIERIREAGYDIPVIMVTGQGDEQVAVKAMKGGADDYVVKTQGYLKTLPGVLERAIEKHDLEGRLKTAEERYQRLAENANDLIFATNREGYFTFLTSRAMLLLGFDAEELLGKNFMEFLTPEGRQRAEHELQKDSKDRSPRLLELDFVSKRGEAKSFELSLTTISRGGRIAGFEIIGRDITQRKALEQKILQRNRELTTLLSVTSSISHSLNIEEVAAIALEKICEFTGLNCGTIYTLRYSDSALAQSGAYNMPRSLLQSLDAPGFWNEILEALFRVKTPLLHPALTGVPGGESLDKLGELCRKEGIRSFIVLPLLFKEKIFGLIFVGSSIQNHVATEQLEILNSICKQISAATANAGLFNAVREAKTEWETTFDAMSELICIQDLAGKIIRVNNAMARRLNVEPRQLVNQEAVDVFNDTNSPWVYHLRTQFYEAGKIVTVEYEDRLLNGIFEIATTPIYTSDGRLFAWLFVGKDITEQRQIQSQMVQVERLKALGEMASGVAHDFNNILAGILGKTQVMLNQLERDGGLDLQTWKQNLKTIEKQAVLGAETVKRIQDFTRIRTDTKFSSVDLNQVVRNAIEIIRPVWKDQREAKGVKIDIQLRPGEIDLVSGIDSELTEVVVNVLSNAIDAMPEGGVIEITSENLMVEGSHCVELRVKDSGIGMSNETIQKVFDPFFSTKGPKGIGLGMSVAYGVITRHQGRILLNSELGRGTTCTIRLPAVEQPEMHVNSQRPSSNEEKKRILVIDDEDIIREFMQEMLVAANFEADVAATGSEGIELFERNTYNLVFSDLGLPGMSGWEVARILKQRKPDIPLILLSGWGIQLDDVRVKQSGVDLVLSKPCQMKEILGAVDEVLKRHKGNTV
jgi:PAS domain S-box-containing protein